MYFIYRNTPYLVPWIKIYFFIEYLSPVLNTCPINYLVSIYSPWAGIACVSWCYKCEYTKISNIYSQYLTFVKSRNICWWLRVIKEKRYYFFGHLFGTGNKYPYKNKNRYLSDIPSTVSFGMWIVIISKKYMLYNHASVFAENSNVIFRRPWSIIHYIWNDQRNLIVSFVWFN